MWGVNHNQDDMQASTSTINQIKLMILHSDILCLLRWSNNGQVIYMAEEELLWEGKQEQPGIPYIPRHNGQYGSLSFLHCHYAFSKVPSNRSLEQKCLSTFASNNFHIRTQTLGLKNL